MHVLISTDDDGRVRLNVIDDVGWREFEELAEFVCCRLHCEVVARYEGLESRTWVLRVADKELLFYCDDYYGVFMLPRSAAENELVRVVGAKLRSYAWPVEGGSTDL